MALMKEGRERKTIIMLNAFVCGVQARCILLHVGGIFFVLKAYYSRGTR
jgi:hypothetical protein